MSAALFRHIHASVVATQAKIFFLISRCRLQQLKFVVGFVWIMALQTVAYRRLMHSAFYLGRILLCVAGQAQTVGSGRSQLYACHILVHANFMTTRAARRYGRVNELTLGFIRVALQTLCGICIFFQRYRMDICSESRNYYKEEPGQHRRCNQARLT
jgi:hypothetical protein